MNTKSTLNLPLTLLTTVALGVGFGCSDDAADTGTNDDEIGLTETAEEDAETTAEGSGEEASTTAGTTTDETADEDTADTDDTAGTTTDTTAGTDTADTDTAEDTADTDTAEDTADTDTAEDTSEESSSSTSTTGNNNGCEAPAAYVDCDGEPGSLTTDPFQALGINCGDDPSSTVVGANASMNSNSASAWRIATQFGSASQEPGDNRYNGALWAANLDPYVSPGEDGVSGTEDDVEVPNNTSSAILVLSTGTISAPDAQGVITETSGSQSSNANNGNDDGDSLPSPLSAQEGSNNGAGGTPFENCDGVNDCSDSLWDQWNGQGWDDPNDKLWMQFDLSVPGGTEGYVFDFAYFSSEYPTYVNTSFNDLFIAWSTSETFTGNLTFVNEAPLTITSLENAGSFQYKGSDAELSGTGFEGHAGTGWFTARGSATPGEQFQITFFIADMGDSALATGTLLDNFRWECAGCVPSEVNSCGIQPQ
ncbi:hypothetical protein G6O69_00540 [Pseudenhygromyxa sp. WMMC2535]|uniref:choice-of-anchor L domain-containing protein n=1 Tax=Pseudenhygromyxa sp. WMMC2535 TaxID=2712867 RepID=UPI001595735D|nr:choice-of-anchor L domain-containing protein [Pseudenhygromyxa sp. WMMC2535]NVB36298.1 hypothetical protein [Pseudenhygromyxa sp. WMMC2535]